MNDLLVGNSLLVEDLVDDLDGVSDLLGGDLNDLLGDCLLGGGGLGLGDGVNLGNGMSLGFSQSLVGGLGDGDVLLGADDVLLGGLDLLDQFCLLSGLSLGEGSLVEGQLSLDVEESGVLLLDDVGGQGNVDDNGFDDSVNEGLNTGS